MAPVRAWVRRPDGLRVESLNGSLVLACRRAPSSNSRAVLYTSEGGRPVSLPPGAKVAPVLGDDGLVRRRPSRSRARYDDPMYRDYHWVAMLDPVELADGHGRWRNDPEPDPVIVDDVGVVDHHGRPAWEALLRPTSSYDPRCPCCPLLFSAESVARHAGAGGSTVLDREPKARYAEAHRVRLDLDTAVCVFIEEVGGPRDGHGHDLVIEAVDEPMPDELFETKREGLLRRFLGR